MTQPSRSHHPDTAPDLDDAALTALTLHPALWGLLAQRLDGWMFVYDPGKPRLSGAVLWTNGWSDSIAIEGETDARAFRVDPAGGDRWTDTGTLRDILDALAELPNPALCGSWPVIPRIIALPGPRGRNCA
jgi:hypothetical protein